MHVFTLDRLDAAYTRQTSRRVARPPLWFTEGLAEFWSKKWDTEADMIVKDMVVGGRLYSIPQLWRGPGGLFFFKTCLSKFPFFFFFFFLDKKKARSHGRKERETV